jgi:signal transduction histidine kinase
VKGTQQPLVRLAIYLRQSRAVILQEWRESVARDPELTTASAISHAQFTDSIPGVLDALEHNLQADDGMLLARAGIEQRRGAAEHGSDRWQQGYNLRETLREWIHLQRCVLSAFERYEGTEAQLDGRAMARARETLVTFFGESVGESAARYARLQQDEAASRMRDLDEAVQQFRRLERHRATMLREAAHDLRGSMGVITNASALLARSEATQQSRAESYRVIDRAISATQVLLKGLLDLARLEAGQETLELREFDAAELIRGLCDGLRPIAEERSLFLRVDGPSPFAVSGDALKLRRIVQNLVLNGLQATESGGVQVSWRDAPLAGAERWMLCIQDTGPGLAAAQAVPFRRALKQVTDQQYESQNRPAEAAPTLPAEPAAGEASVGPHEGIGLSIVKRLCELLDAGLELETGAEQGTTFRLSLPRRYPQRTARKQP